MNRPQYAVHDNTQLDSILYTSRLFATTSRPPTLRVLRQRLKCGRRRMLYIKHTTEQRRSQGNNWTPNPHFSCVHIGDAVFALASHLWKRARSNWNNSIMCSMVSIHSQLLFFWYSDQRPQNYRLSKQNYAKSATWRMNIYIIVSHARPALVNSVPQSIRSFFSVEILVVLKSRYIPGDHHCG